MFGSHATRLARIDWSKYGAMERTDPPTLESLQRENDGIRAGLRQLAEELANMFGNYDVPVSNRAPIISSAYHPSAPGVSAEEDELDKFYPQMAGLSGDSYFDPDDSLVKGGQAWFGQGVHIFQPAWNNPNVAAGGIRHKIVLKGGREAGICFENIFVDNLYDLDGNPWTGGAATLPAGTVTLWAGDVGDIPTGWALMDGTANSVGNGGSGIDMRGLIPYGYSGAGDFATIGGSIVVALATGFSGSGTAALTIATNTTGITVDAHSSHTHDTSLAGSTVASLLLAHGAAACTVTDSGHTHTVDSFSANIGDSSATSPASVVTSVDASTSLETTGITVDTPSLSHTGTGSVSLTSGGPSASLTHSVNDSGHGHTGTVTINDVAAGLTIGTPTTVRTPGVVLAYIEKLA
jgi:hypothetical protein